MNHDYICVSEDDFHKSSFSAEYTFIPRRCVEVAVKGNFVCVRNPDDKSKQTLVFDADEWVAFVMGVKKGEFDLE